ncbi:hypothetical protein MHYP_G00160660 [Metynnis hypsauchen]
MGWVGGLQDRPSGSSAPAPALTLRPTLVLLLRLPPVTTALLDPRMHTYSYEPLGGTSGGYGLMRLSLSLCELLSV